MIVRINQIDVAAAESAGGWEPVGPQGGIDYAWPSDTFAYQLLVLEHDEQNHPLTIAFRQKQIRRLIPQVIEALSENGSRVCIRLDGHLTEGELPALFRYVADSAACERFTITPIQKLQPGPDPAPASIQLLPTPDLLSTICHDPQIGLDRGVRLRAFGLPEELVNPLLDTIEPDDERWRDILPATSFLLSTTKDLSSLTIWTSRFDVPEIKNRIMQKLSGVR